MIIIVEEPSVDEMREFNFKEVYITVLSVESFILYLISLYFHLIIAVYTNFICVEVLLK